MLLTVQVVLTKLTNGQKKFVLNTPLKLKVTARRKVTALNINLCFIYILFLAPIKCKQLREAWMKAVRREPFYKKGSWKPAASHRVCSIYFVDGLATDENPIPTLFLGYKSKIKKSRRTLFRKPFEKKVR